MKLNRPIYKIILLTLAMVLFAVANISAQAVPSKDENIPFLVTFGKEGKVSWGDDDFNEIWFFLIPPDYKKPFYIRVFDADCGGENDEIQGEFNTKTLFSVYGGVGANPDVHEESRGLENNQNYKKGNLLASRVFSTEAKYDNKYYTFGPFNPSAGEFSAKWNRYVFKVVCEGIEGDDGNLYRYFLSSDGNNNIPIEGANAFTYEYTFRMWNDFKSVAHIYPYIDSTIISIKQTNFDWDNDGVILVVSKYKSGVPQKISNEADEASSTLPVLQGELGSSLDFQFHKRKGELVKNNNVVITLKTQRGDALPFYSSPIGGVPVFEPKMKYEPIPPKKK